LRERTCRGACRLRQLLSAFSDLPFESGIRRPELSATVAPTHCQLETTDRIHRLADRLRNILCATVRTRDVVRLDAATFRLQPTCFSTFAAPVEPAVHANSDCGLPAMLRHPTVPQGCSIERKATRPACDNVRKWAARCYAHKRICCRTLFSV